MALFAVAAFEKVVDSVISLHVIEATTWQEAMNKSPAIHWNTPADMDYEEAQAFAHSEYRHFVSVIDFATTTIVK